MKKYFLSVSIVTILTLTGCAIEQTMFDVPQSQWNTLTPEQKQEVIKGYNERKHTEAQIAPVKQAIGVAGKYLENKHTENFLNE